MALRHSYEFVLNAVISKNRVIFHPFFHFNLSLEDQANVIPVFHWRLERAASDALRPSRWQKEGRVFVFSAGYYCNHSENGQSERAAARSAGKKRRDENER